MCRRCPGAAQRRRSRAPGTRSRSGSLDPYGRSGQAAPHQVSEGPMRAFIFPGQGSQSVGMGAALAGASRLSRDVFDEVDEALGQNLFRLMRDGPDEELKLTKNAQPAIMAHSIAVFRALGVSLPDVASFAAGHSLG